MQITNGLQAKEETSKKQRAEAQSAPIADVEKMFETEQGRAAGPASREAAPHHELPKSLTKTKDENDKVDRQDLVLLSQPTIPPTPIHR